MAIEFENTWYGDDLPVVPRHAVGVVCGVHDGTIGFCTDFIQHGCFDRVSVRCNNPVSM